MRIWTAVLCATVGVAGCATITEGSTQMLTFNIEPGETHCVLTRVGDGELGVVTRSRNFITVSKDRDDIVVSCNAAGYKPMTRPIASSATAAGMASVLLIDFGITDMATGAMWKYPETQNISLEPEALTAASTEGALQPSQRTPVQGRP